MDTFDERMRDALQHRRAAIERAAAERPVSRGRRAAPLAAMTEAERREIAEIDAAIERIGRGSYGHCEDCGHAIGRLRLRAMPEARRCAACDDVREASAT